MANLILSIMGEISGWVSAIVTTFGLPDPISHSSHSSDHSHSSSDKSSSSDDNDSSWDDRYSHGYDDND